MVVNIRSYRLMKGKPYKSGQPLQSSGFCSTVLSGVTSFFFITSSRFSSNPSGSTSIPVSFAALQSSTNSFFHLPLLITPPSRIFEAQQIFYFRNYYSFLLKCESTLHYFKPKYCMQYCYTTT